jgi:hypothetical protein
LLYSSTKPCGLDAPIEIIIFITRIKGVPLLEGLSDNLKTATIIIEVLPVLELAGPFNKSPQVPGVVHMVFLLGRVKA